MTPEQVKKAGEALENIKILEESIRVGGCSVVAKEDWAHGCGVFPCRMEMLHALTTAQNAASAVMKSAADRQIEVLKKQLEEMGVSDSSNAGGECRTAQGKTP
jgi:hypothetical protein